MSEIQTLEHGKIIVLPENADSIAAVIDRAARDKSVDIDKLERLLAMKERIDARAAEAAFNESMKFAQEEMPNIFRDAKNSHTNSRYARLESVNNAVVPVYTRHGFSLSFGTAECPRPGFYRVTCIVSHIAGHSRSYQCDIPDDGQGAKGNANKTATHAFGSTMSYARRYLTLLIFNLTLTNEDDDANPNPKPDHDGDAPKVAPRQSRGELDSKMAALSSAWKSKNEQRLGEPDAEYRNRFFEWAALKLALESPDAPIPWTAGNIDKLMGFLK